MPVIARLCRGLVGVLLLFAGAPALAVTYATTPTGYAWIDPASHTNITWSGGTQCSSGGVRTDDDITALINIGFTFNFGGTNYTQLRVMANGRLQFNNSFCGYGTQTVSPRTYPYGMPTTNTNRTMRVYGADLDPSASGTGTTCPSATCHVRYASLGTAPNRYFVVTWTRVPEWSAGGSFFNLQVILYENGEFVFQYGTANNASGGAAQVGWQVSGSDFAIAQSGVPASGTALRFWKPPTESFCIPAGYVLGAGASGLAIGGGTVNGTAISGSGDALRSTGVRGSFVASSSTLSPSSFPSISGSANANTSGVPGGTYASVGAGSAGFVMTGGTYYIQNFNVNTASLTLGPGDYFIQNLSLANNLAITVAPAGRVRLFLGSNVSARDNVTINAGGSAANFQVFVYGSAGFQLGNQYSFTGILFAPGNADFEFGNTGTFNGAAVTGGEIQFGTGAAFTYSATTQSQVASTTSCPSSSVASFLVTSAATASTCVAQPVVVTALDSLGNTLSTYTGTVSLSTSAGRGLWTATGAAGTLAENGNANDGIASYTFATADHGQATLQLADQAADNLTVTVTDASNGASGTSTSIGFRDNAFVITPTDALGTTVVAGRPHRMQATLYRRDTSLATPDCAVATNYAGSHALQAWYTPDASHPAGATAPAIDSGSLLGTAVPGSPNVTLTFTAGVASFDLTTADVGKYTLNLRDGSRNFANAVDIDGSSATLTVRPFAVVATAAVKGATANPEGTATSGAKFVAAGDTFATTIAAWLWSAADDADNDGTPDSGANVLDNGRTPRFAWATALAAAGTAGLFTPAGGTLGSLGGTTTVGAGSFTAGAATVSDLTYGETGSTGLSVTVTDYLGSSGVSLAGGYVNPSSGQAARLGRFFPAEFALASSSVTPSCGAGNQTYMDEPALGLAFTLEARNVAGAVTANYATGSHAVGTVGLSVENADAGTDLGARVTGLPSVAWTLGRYVFATSSATFTRAAAPDGPYDSVLFGVTVVDADGAAVASADMNATTAGACGTGCTARRLNAGATTRVRFGRLKIGNALGAPQLDLPVPLTAQYWNGQAFATNAQDGCTRFTNTQFAFANYRAPLAACLTSGTPAGAAAIVLAGGRGTLRLSRPGVRGSVDLTAQLGASASGSTCSAGVSAATTAANRPWLRGNWGAATWDRDPAARAVFGVYGTGGDVIHQRESY